MPETGSTLDLRLPTSIHVVGVGGAGMSALAMVLDQLTPDSIPGLELATGVPVIYTLNADSTVASKEVVV